MKRIGLVDLDTSHAAQFAMRLNHVGIDKDQWVDGGKVVVACTGKSIIYPERLPIETKSVKDLGVPIVETPEQMLDYKLDAVFVESNCGSQHLERAKLFLAAKLPLFVDKPFACSTADAKEMIELAEKAGVPITGGSSLRFAPEIVALAKDPLAKSENLGCVAYGPASKHPKNPGLFHYGVHAVEMLYAIMGAGCQWLTCVTTDQADVATGAWKDGRIGSVRGQRPGSPYGVLLTSATGEKWRAVDTRFIYRDQLRAIVSMLETGKPPIPTSELLEVVRFIEAAETSGSNHGLPQTL